MVDLSATELDRYGRQLVMKDIGVEGQKKLKEGRVLIVGTGGLGSPAAFYLAAAGVGEIGLVDSDAVELSNLQRQILHHTGRLGRPKVESGRETLLALNPEIKVRTYHQRLDENNVKAIIRDYDIIIGAVDNFASRYLLNDACVAVGKTLIEGGVLQWDGLIMTIRPGLGPCYRCIFPETPPPGAVPGTRELGVIGVVPGVIGTLEAAEAIKLLLGVGRNLVGRLLLFSALDMRFREVKAERNPNCPACGKL
ncbi:MAG: hypothetical protein PWP65_367 [Clostridia bacterium]|nr:hypothetical protein [Clostridia bacterium]